MKSKINFFHIKILVLITLLIVLVLHKTSAQAEPVKVAITPFTLNAPENMQYLKSGVQDMLESRLSQDADVIVISKAKTAQAMEGIAEPVDENEARDIGRRLNADYVLIGSLSVFGSSVSLDARLVDSAGEKETRAFFDQSASIDELVPKINDVAADINAEMTGATAVAAVGPDTAPEAAGNDVQAHPEKMTENEIQAETDTEGKAMVVDPAGGIRSTQFWKSRTYKINIHGMALGDVDGDRKIETVVISGNELFIFRSEANKFYKIHELKQASNKQFIGVDVGDINGNGMAEIFVSGLTPQRTAVSSFVLEFDGKAYQTLVTNSRRLFRVIHGDGQAPMLFGQDFIPKIEAAQPIYRLHAAGTSYTAGDNVIARDAINLMGFAYGNVLTRDSNSVVAYTYADRLELFDENGVHEWTSNEHLGGSTLSFSKGMVGQGEIDYRFLPMRVLLKDLDHDGQQEVIAVKNYEIASRTLKDFRVLSDFHIVSLSWDGLGLQANWQTPKTSGQVRDYAIGDFDNDGQDELVAAIVMREDKIIGVKPKSAIIAYEMAAQPKP